MIDELNRALDEIELGEDIRVAILTGAGKAFSAGMPMGTPGAKPPEPRNGRFLHADDAIENG